MHEFLDDFLVGAVLLASVGYALFALGPRTLRRRSLSLAAALLELLPGTSWLRPLALRLNAAASKPKGACGGCDNCEATPASVSPAANSEVRIPLTKIGKRPGVS